MGIPVDKQPHLLRCRQIEDAQTLAPYILLSWQPLAFRRTLQYAESLACDRREHEIWVLQSENTHWIFTGCYAWIFRCPRLKKRGTASNREKKTLRILHCQYTLIQYHIVHHGIHELLVVTLKLRCTVLHLLRLFFWDYKANKLSLIWCQIFYFTLACTQRCIEHST